MKRWINALKENDMFAWGDLIIVGILILLSFTPLLIFTQQENAKQQEVISSASKSPEIIAVVSHDGKKLKIFNLTNQKKKITYTYRDPDGDINVIEVKNHKIRVSFANCTDQLCVKQGAKSKVGQSIVCLPHKLLIEVKSSSATTNNDDGLVN